MIKDYLRAVRYARLIKKYSKDKTLYNFYLNQLEKLHDNELADNHMDIYLKLKESELNLKK